MARYIREDALGWRKRRRASEGPVVAPGVVPFSGPMTVLPLPPEVLGQASVLAVTPVRGLSPDCNAARRSHCNRQGYFRSPGHQDRYRYWLGSRLGPGARFDPGPWATAEFARNPSADRSQLRGYV